MDRILKSTSAITPRASPVQSVRQLQAAIFQLPYHDASLTAATSTNTSGKGGNSQAVVRTCRPLMADSRPLVSGWFGGWYWLSAQEITQWPRCREQITRETIITPAKKNEESESAAENSEESAKTTTLSTGWQWTDEKRESIHRKLNALALRGKGPLARNKETPDANAGKKKKKR